jgi:hypothetical protein
VLALRALRSLRLVRFFEDLWNRSKRSGPFD